MKISDATSNIFDLFINFLYTDRIPRLLIDDAMKLIILSEKYDVQDLKTKCENSIIEILDKNSPAHDIFQLAHMYNCSDKLKKDSFDLLRK